MIDKIAKIVGRCRRSTAVQEELRVYRIKLLKMNQTRWNSILFMIRSFLKLTPEELNKILSLLPDKEKIKITKVEREMLVELRDLLILFETFTDYLQSDKVNISKVYPCVATLKSRLLDPRLMSSLKHTKELRQELFKSLTTRFGSLVEEDDLFKVATFLDPNNGLVYFKVKNILINKNH